MEQLTKPTDNKTPAEKRFEEAQKKRVNIFFINDK